MAIEYGVLGMITTVIGGLLSVYGATYKILREKPMILLRT